MAAAPGDRPIEQMLAHAWAPLRHEATAEQWRIQHQILVRQGFPQCLASYNTLYKELLQLRADMESGSLGLVVYGQQEPGQSPLSPAGEGGAGDL